MRTTSFFDALWETVDAINATDSCSMNFASPEGRAKMRAINQAAEDPEWDGCLGYVDGIIIRTRCPTVHDDVVRRDMWCDRKKTRKKKKASMLSLTTKAAVVAKAGGG